jgi:glycosyltransferase involved in cell wall biosynthesis
MAVFPSDVLANQRRKLDLAQLGRAVYPRLLTAPKVSIVVPNYNYAQFLNERLSSLLNQTYENFELIVVDDGSTDESLQVIESYSSDPRLRLLAFERNSGSTYQRWNDGASIAVGEYVMFAGADDSCAAGLLERLVGVLDSHPEVGVAYCQSWIIDSSGKQLRKKPSALRWCSDFIANGPEEAGFLLTASGIPTASAALIRRSIFEACGRWSTSLQLCSDYMLWANILRAAKLAYVADPLNYFRRHDKTVSSNTSQQSVVLEKYQVADFILREFCIPPTTRELGLDLLTKAWVDQLLRDWRRPDLRTTYKIFRAAIKRDSRLGQRLVANVISQIKRRFEQRSES